MPWIKDVTIEEHHRGKKLKKIHEKIRFERGVF
jgi:hypothetical protein